MIRIDVMALSYLANMTDKSRPSPKTRLNVLKISIFPSASLPGFHSQPCRPLKHIIAILLISHPDIQIVIFEKSIDMTKKTFLLSYEGIFGLKWQLAFPYKLKRIMMRLIFGSTARVAWNIQAIITLRKLVT